MKKYSTTHTFNTHSYYCVIKSLDDSKHSNIDDKNDGRLILAKFNLGS